jgi:hypothetical protein
MFIARECIARPSSDWSLNVIVEPADEMDWIHHADRT